MVCYTADKRTFVARYAVKMGLTAIMSLFLWTAGSGSVWAVCSATPTPDVAVIRISKNVLKPNETVSISVSTNESPGKYRVAIMSSTGQPIQTMDDQTFDGTTLAQPVERDYVWCGKSATGGQCAPGVYLIVVTLPSHTKVNRVMIVN